MRILAWFSRLFCSRISNARSRRSLDLSAATFSAVAFRMAATAASGNRSNYAVPFQVLKSARYGIRVDAKFGSSAARGWELIARLEKS